MRLLASLFLSFATIGIGAYGGGLISIPLIQHEVIYKRGWIQLDELEQLFAIAQMTPGPIAINAATYVGYSVYGYIGALLATFSVIFPSVMILLFFIPIIDILKSNIHFKLFLQGLQIGVTSLILFAVWSYGSVAVRGPLDLVISLAAFAILTIFEGKFHPVFIIFACGVLGIFIF